MIDFDCPACAEPMEISDRMANKQVRCPLCAETVDVPHKRRRRKAKSEPGLSTSEWILFTLLFVAIPIVNVIASSVLYYMWRNEKPRRATQINLLGFAVFGFHVFVRILVYLAFRI